MVRYTKRKSNESAQQWLQRVSVKNGEQILEGYLRFKKRRKK